MTTDRTDFDPAAALARIAAATGQLLGTASKFSDADVRAPSLLPDWSRGHVPTHLARNADGGRHLLTWARGQERPAARAAEARLCEVLVHHADLDAGFTPAHWPADFVATMLDRLVASFGARDDAPVVRLDATDTGTGYVMGDDPPAPVVRGSQSSLPAWLVGRSPGTDLAVDDARGLPRPLFLYRSPPRPDGAGVPDRASRNRRSSSRAGALSASKAWKPSWPAGTAGPHSRTPWHSKQKASRNSGPVAPCTRMPQPGLKQRRMSPSGRAAIRVSARTASAPSQTPLSSPPTSSAL
ncbi:maleylpyruvate isomerase N-terminal domain-containing protein [Streptomyces misionensis]|uniref:maleylpyruvate isomerase N-terminal domain-containing protein n=1 Tax=Streptomyces misionensis TaxID=67331 RepID=UPI003683F459